MQLHGDTIDTYYIQLRREWALVIRRWSFQNYHGRRIARHTIVIITDDKTIARAFMVRESLCEQWSASRSPFMPRMDPRPGWRERSECWLVMPHVMPGTSSARLASILYRMCSIWCASFTRNCTTRNWLLIFWLPNVRKSLILNHGTWILSRIFCPIYDQLHN